MSLHTYKQKWNQSFPNLYSFWKALPWKAECTFKGCCQLLEAFWPSESLCRSEKKVHLILEVQDTLPWSSAPPLLSPLISCLPLIPGPGAAIHKDPPKEGAPQPVEALGSKGCPHQCHQDAGGKCSQLMPGQTRLAEDGTLSFQSRSTH